MITTKDVLNPQGLRRDGRKADELRKFYLKTRVLARADGSSYVSQGGTTILCSVNGPSESKASNSGLMVEYLYNQRRKGDIAATMLEAFRPVLVDKKSLNTSCISIVVMVLQDDGGHVPVAINAITLALIDAGIQILDFLVGVSIGLFQQQPILDLSTFEERHRDVEARVQVAVMPRSQKMTHVSLESKVPSSQLGLLLDRATDVAVAAFGVLDEHVRRMAGELMKRRHTALPDDGALPSRNHQEEEEEEERDAVLEPPGMMIAEPQAKATTTTTTSTTNTTITTNTTTSTAAPYSTHQRMHQEPDTPSDRESGELSPSDMEQDSGSEKEGDQGMSTANHVKMETEPHGMMKEEEQEHHVHHYQHQHPPPLPLASVSGGAGSGAMMGQGQGMDKPILSRSRLDSDGDDVIIID